MEENSKGLGHWGPPGRGKPREEKKRQRKRLPVTKKGKEIRSPPMGDLIGDHQEWSEEERGTQVKEFFYHKRIVRAE